MLRSLELFGFKSFAERTVFDFAPGITGVVGPNGSGKSNVVDAIKWILGDQSAKSLRGKEMMDVIFNGAAGRRPSNLAEATLTFDNSNGFLPIESREVQIGRRLWRNGDSEYLINRTPSRLKDIRDLFMGTGAGSAAYCIIEQGRVDQILQANATTRRAIFEEAAGISRYKARRTEAIRKLDRVEQNLLRLTDIVEEVESQLNSIRNQATKAARFRETSTQLREWWIGLAADDFRHNAAQLEEFERNVQTSVSDLTQLNARLQTLDRKLSALDAEIADVDDRLREAERKSAATREAIASSQSTIRHQTARKHELDLELVRLRKQRTSMAGRVQEAIDEGDHIRAQLDRFEAEFQKLSTEHRNREIHIARSVEKIESGRKNVEAMRKQMRERTHVVSESESRVAEFELKIQAAATARQSAVERQQSLQEQIDSCRNEHQQRRGSLQDAKDVLADCKEKIVDIQQRREMLIGEQGEFRDTLGKQREQRSAWQARKSILENMERRQDGFGIGVKEILSRARTSSRPPWNQIRGSVADLLEADLEQAALLEVALGSRAQLIVIEEFDSLVDYLHRESYQLTGRVGFLACRENQSAVSSTETTPGEKRDAHSSAGTSGPVDCEGNAAAVRDLSGQPGVRERADQLVRPCKRLPLLAERLLADTWIVDTLETALKLSADAGKGCRFVTQQGELLESNGSLTVGTVSSDTAIVSRKSELRQLKTDLVAIDRAITTEERRLTDLVDSLREVDDELQSSDARMQSAATQHAELKSEFAAVEKVLGRLQDDWDSLAGEIEQIDGDSKSHTTDIHNAQMEHARAIEDLQAIQLKIEESQRGLAREEHRLQTFEEKRSSGQLELAKHEERLSGLREACKRLEEDQQQRILQSREAERRFHSVDKKRREISLHVLGANANLAELFLTEEQFSQHAAGFFGKRERMQNQRAQLLQQANDLREQRRELNEAKHSEEIKVRDIRFQITTLEGRIAEEYQLVLGDLVSSGASAVKIHREQQGRKHPDSAPRASSGLDTESPKDAESPDAVDPAAGQADAPQGDGAEDGVRLPIAGTAQGDGDAQADDTPFEEIRGELEVHVNRLRRKLKLMGSVNTDSLRDLDELEQRYGLLSHQLEDLTEAKTALEGIVNRIDAESKRLFNKSFDAVNLYFQELFRKAFGGGDGSIVLEDPDDVLECGIDIVARPPGKELKSISLLSGGEKTLTAFALLLALFRSRPSPYCLLDEVDAALDEANVGRMLELLEEFKQTTQFIIVTHKKPTMTITDALYGVTMEQSGVSKRLSVRFEDVRENGEFDIRKSDPSTTSSPRDDAHRDAA
jgi:chromosome segregation protein